MGRERLKTASSEKDHQRMAAWPPAGAMRPQRKSVPAAMALYGMSAEGYSKCFLSGSDVQCSLELDPPDGAASPPVTSAQTRVALGEWEMATVENCRGSEDTPMAPARRKKTRRRGTGLVVTRRKKAERWPARA
jgi:hypothetical protein